MRMIVRSHELVHSGWAIAGKKDVITVFSAVDYRNTGNDGALRVRCWPLALPCCMASWRSNCSVRTQVSQLEIEIYPAMVATEAAYRA